jgi:Acyl-CoA reductase (LuxC)
MSTPPLIIRGRELEGHPAEHLHDLVLTDPAGLRELHQLRLEEIIDYLVALGERLHVDENPHLAQALAQIPGPPTIQRFVFNNLHGMLRRDVIEEYVEQNIGRRFLEGWVDVDLLDRQIAVRAFGARTVHVIAGNSPAIALQTVMSNALTRGDAIVKLPGNDPVSTVALARTMIEMAPDHPLTRHLSVAYWKGGDEMFERKLYSARNLEKIVAWGGWASMQSIRQYLEPGLDLVALDPKLSASLIGSAALESEETMRDAAQRAAADIGYFNQAGCVSARVLYLDSGTDPEGIGLANRFGEMVHEAIQALPPELSTPVETVDPVLREELQGIRFTRAFKLFGGRGNEGAVIVSQEDEPVDFAHRLDGRVANIVPVDGITSALRRLTIHTQTIGIYPDELKRELRDECAIRGGQRIVSLGHATSASLAGPHDAIQPLSRMVRWLRDDTLDAPSGMVHNITTAETAAGA